MALWGKPGAMIDGMYMLCAKLEFAQSMDCPAQSHDTCFAQKSMDCAVIAQTMDSPTAW